MTAPRRRQCGVAFLPLGIMRSAGTPNPAETLGFRLTAPHNHALRIIRFGLTRSAGVG
jgi:hypothetical protein